MFGPTLSKEEQLLAARVGDMLTAGRARFTHFLSERERLIAESAAAHSGRAVFCGGYPGAERVMLGVFPVRAPGDPPAFPICALTLTWHKTASLSHRDILGALMSLSLTRESIGDILTAPQRAFVFLTETAAAMALAELDRVGGAGVHCTEGADLTQLPEPRFEVTAATVSSLRLDTVVAAMTHKSRGEACELIRAGLVRLGAADTDDRAHPVAFGDKISVHGYGKAAVESGGGVSKKGRIRIEIRKYL